MNSIIASTSTVHGSSYLEYLKPELEILFNGCKSILFIPFARPGGITHEEYTEKAKQGLSFLKDTTIVGLHTFKNYTEAIQSAEAIFTGGGNTFLLTKQLHENNLLTPLREKILRGMPYLGTSAGSNICGKTISTTNDMPIVYPPSFEALGILNFNINPHYLDPDPHSTHKGETRETRILEFLNLNSTPVVGLREGSWIRIQGNSCLLKGKLNARLFLPSEKPKEIAPDFNFNTLG